MWLIEADVLQMPQLHKHFNVSRHLMLKILQIIIVMTLAAGQESFAQNKNLNFPLKLFPSRELPRILKVNLKAFACMKAGFCVEGIVF